jgi:hypothetical protein
MHGHASTVQNERQVVYMHGSWPTTQGNIVSDIWAHVAITGTHKHTQIYITECCWAAASGGTLNTWCSGYGIELKNVPSQKVTCSIPVQTRCKLPGFSRRQPVPKAGVRKELHFLASALWGSSSNRWLKHWSTSICRNQGASTGICQIGCKVLCGRWTVVGSILVSPSANLIIRVRDHTSASSGAGPMELVSIGRVHLWFEEGLLLLLYMTIYIHIIMTHDFSLYIIHGYIHIMTIYNQPDDKQ